MQSGKSAEHLLVAELTARGYTVSIPVLDVPYDLVLEKNRGFSRIQVKSTKTKGERGSAFKCVFRKSGNKSYDSNNVDIAAIYVEPEKVWYFIPISLINVACLYLYPNEKKGKFDTYEDYWKIFEL